MFYKHMSSLSLPVKMGIVVNLLDSVLSKGSGFEPASRCYDFMILGITPPPRFTEDLNTIQIQCSQFDSFSPLCLPTTLYFRYFSGFSSHYNDTAAKEMQIAIHMNIYTQVAKRTD